MTAAAALVRKAAGIEFAGTGPTLSNLIAEVEMRQEPACEPAWGLRHDALGFHGLSKTESGRMLVVVTEATLDRTGEPGLRDLSEALVAVYGTDFGLHRPSWISRFTDAARQAVFYRKGRVLLAGDAAHIHHSVGGQGLNIGVQDAVNLGWKLAQVVKGVSPDSLLDTYHTERHPVAARVLRNTMAQIALLRRGEDGLKAAREVVSELLAMDAPRRRFGAMMSGLDVHYDLGKGHPLLGRRMPDLDLTVDGQPLRLFTLLHGARGLLLNFSKTGGLDIAPWAGRIDRIDAECEGPWQLPAIGQVAAPGAVLVRPDGHVAWVGDGSQRGHAEALTMWFGPAGGLARPRPRSHNSTSFFQNMRYELVANEECLQNEMDALSGDFCTQQTRYHVDLEFFSHARFKWISLVVTMALEKLAEMIANQPPNIGTAAILELTDFLRLEAGGWGHQVIARGKATAAWTVVPMPVPRHNDAAELT
ncbi:hypothetical protein ACVWZZ_001167 [Bradyrhizobium sp. LM6.10]